MLNFRKRLSLTKYLSIVLITVSTCMAHDAKAQNCRNTPNYDVDRVVFCNTSDTVRYVKKVWPSGQSNFRVRPGDFVPEHLTSNGGVCFQYTTQDGLFDPELIFFARKGRLINLSFPVADSSCTSNGIPNSVSIKALSGLADLYPAAPLGSAKHFVLLPKIADEANKKIELIVGRKVIAEECAGVWINATTNVKYVKVTSGFWPYFSVEGVTFGNDLVACHPSKTVEKLALVSGIRQIDYNSELPLVVYAPTGYIVQYRIWSSSDSMDIPEKNSSQAQ